MTVNAGDVFVFVFGLVPQYVSIIAVEKHFTNFWTGFWNIYGLIAVISALILSSDNAALIFSGVLVALVLSTMLLISLQPGFAPFARSFGASLATTSVSWGLVFWFISNSATAGGIVFLIHAIALFLVRDAYRKGQARIATRRLRQINRR